LCCKVIYVNTEYLQRWPLIGVMYFMQERGRWCVLYMGMSVPVLSLFRIFQFYQGAKGGREGGRIFRPRSLGKVREVLDIPYVML